MTCGRWTPGGGSPINHRNEAGAQNTCVHSRVGGGWRLRGVLIRRRSWRGHKSQRRPHNEREGALRSPRSVRPPSPEPWQSHPIRHNYTIHRRHIEARGHHLASHKHTTITQIVQMLGTHTHTPLHHTTPVSQSQSTTPACTLTSHTCYTTLLCNLTPANT